MPGKRVPSDPFEADGDVKDASPTQAGIQNAARGPAGGAQYRKGEAPHDNAYREKANQEFGNGEHTHGGPPLNVHPS